MKQISISISINFCFILFHLGVIFFWVLQKRKQAPKLGYKGGRAQLSAWGGNRYVGCCRGLSYFLIFSSPQTKPASRNCVSIEIERMLLLVLFLYLV